MDLKELVEGLRAKLTDDTKVLETLIAMANDGKIILKEDEAPKKGEDEKEPKGPEDEDEKGTREEAEKIFGMKFRD